MGETSKPGKSKDDGVSSMSAPFRRSPVGASQSPKSKDQRDQQDQHGWHTPPPMRDDHDQDQDQRREKSFAVEGWELGETCTRSHLIGDAGHSEQRMRSG